jgi:hypothetical protein
VYIEPLKEKRGFQINEKRWSCNILSKEENDTTVSFKGERENMEIISCILQSTFFKPSQKPKELEQFIPDISFITQPYYIIEAGSKVSFQEEQKSVNFAQFIKYISKLQVKNRISFIILQRYIWNWLQSYFKQEQKPEELEQQALFYIVHKFSKIERVKSIYVQRYRRELQIFVLLLVDKYDADLMDKLLDIEYEIRKMFPDIVFQFFYPPAGISEKKDFIHPQAECIYKNLSLPPELENTDIIKIEEMYEFSDKERVRNFILQNKDLIRILKEAPEHIYKIFGKNIKLYLELHSDPEENWDELFIIIKSPHSAEKAHELGRQLFREWFVKIIKRVGNRLNFSEEPL